MNATDIKIRIKGNKDTGWTCQPVSMKITLKRNADRIWERKTNDRNNRITINKHNQDQNGKTPTKNDEKITTKNDAKTNANNNEKRNGERERDTSTTGDNQDADEPRSPTLRDANLAPRLHNDSRETMPAHQMPP